MSNMMIHCGGKPVNFAELTAIETPKQTDTYEPVAFADILTNTKSICDDLLDLDFVDQKLAISKNEQRFFGLLQYKDPENEEIGKAIGIRSSHDKSMSIGFCAGASVFVCDNMAFTGEVTYMRKHTKNVFNDLQDKLVSVLYKSKDKFANILKDAEAMKDVKISSDDAYSFIGRALGYQAFGARQATDAIRHWNSPPYSEFMDQTVWSLYNACTEALKSTPPNKILERHISLHNRTLFEFGIG